MVLLEARRISEGKISPKFSPGRHGWAQFCSLRVHQVVAAGARRWAPGPRSDTRDSADVLEIDDGQVRAPGAAVNRRYRWEIAR